MNSRDDEYLNGLKQRIGDLNISSFVMKCIYKYQIMKLVAMIQTTP